VWTGDGSGVIYTYNTTWLANVPGTVMNNHTGGVNAILRINQNQVATASSDKTIKVWNVNSGALVSTFYGHTGVAADLSILPGGILASGGQDNTVRFWNMETQTVSIISGLAVGSYPICQQKFIPQAGVNGTLVTTGSYLNFFDAVSLTYIKTMNTGHEYWNMDVHAPTGNFLVGSNTIMDFFNASNGYTCTGQFSYTASTGMVKSIKILPDNATVAVGISNGQIQLFSLTTMTWGTAYTVHTAVVNALVVTPDSAYLVSGSDDATVILWLWSTDSLTQRTRFTVPSVVRRIAFMETIFTGSTNISRFNFGEIFS
jgi:WD40 repeat protein